MFLYMIHGLGLSVECQVASSVVSEIFIQRQMKSMTLFTVHNHICININIK